MSCSEVALKPVYVIDTASLNNPCQPRIIMSTVNACPVIEADTLEAFYSKYRILIGGCLMIAGLAILVSGMNLAKLAF
jgi:hypothetical protein